MSKCYIKYGTVVSPLGIGVEDHFNALNLNRSGIKNYFEVGINSENLSLGRIEFLEGNRYVSLLNLACNDLLMKIGLDLLSSEETLVIVSSTKGDIDTLPGDTFFTTREILREKFHIKHKPIIISNACISGVSAINMGKDYLNHSNFKHVVVLGIDLISDFVLFGFQSLFAISADSCKPFDKSRNGITLGEACAIVILSKDRDLEFSVELCGGASSNDANHISGPSRTGEGLYRAIENTLIRSNMSATEIDFISAHGTGTIYNDEMESIAFQRLNIHNKPMNSFKSYFGHTLGAAGVIEVIMCMISMEKNRLFKSLGFESQGTSIPLNIVEMNAVKELGVVLKTASGFGGGNSALIMKVI